MKKLLTLTLMATAMFATDYSSMTIDELAVLRGTVPTEERADFQSAMQSKMQALTPEERANYRGGIGTQNQTQQRNQTQTQQRLRDGSGAGSMNMYQGSRGGGGGGGPRR